MPERTSIVVECNVPVPMRDGTVLSADVYRAADDRPTPVILTRTPYDKSAVGAIAAGFDPMRAVRAGYTVVVQDTRGRYASEGRFYAFRHEADDGYDTVEWCARQPWSSGPVGMYGRSYVGLTQWQAALRRPPHLAAIVPGITAADYHEGWTYQGGAFELGFNLSWTLNTLATDSLWRRRHEIAGFGDVWAATIEAIDAMSRGFRFLPLVSFEPLKVEDCAPYYFDWLAHPDYDEYWQSLDVSRHHHQITTPALNIGGWYDIFLGGTIANYLGMREKGATDQARSGQRLLIGPWAHVTPFANPVGDVDFGRLSSQAAIDLDGIYLRYYDRWLKGELNGVDDEPTVRIFVMGDNVWRSENEWPLARARYVPYYFHSDGKANSLRGDGLLGPEKPSDENADHFLYDPWHPVPTRGGGLCCYTATLPIGPYDQREIEERDDVLVYSTPPLEHDLEVTGPVVVTLFASSSAPDTDFTAKLVDVGPDGYARNLTDGIIRARYRDSPRGKPTPIEPGRVYEYTIDLWATSNVFKAGHQIRLEVSSSNFPRFDRNPNTGHAFGRDKELRPALQTILHDRAHPSCVVLPVIPR
jgi:putative CocE/NonD family hydrolase